MKQNQYLFLLFALIVLTGCGGTQKKLTEYVNPFLGTATLWEPEDLGYTRKIKSRTWGAETYPGATLPNAMVQLSPVTQFRSGAGYQYEDTVIYGFSHTAKGHWNLLHVPMLPVVGTIAVSYTHLTLPTIWALELVACPHVASGGNYRSG